MNKINIKFEKISKRGFTIFELLITVSVAVIIGTIGLISFSNVRFYQDLKLTTQEMAVVLRNAQDRAISQESGSGWGVYFQNPSSGDSFYELFSGASYPGTAVSRNFLRSRIKFENPPINSSLTVIFSPISGLPNSPATIKIFLSSDSSASSTIIVGGNGKIEY